MNKMQETTKVLTVMKTLKILKTKNKLNVTLSYQWIPIENSYKKNRLFLSENVYIIPCPTIQKASEILRNPKFYGQHTIIIHTGVSNIKKSVRPYKPRGIRKTTHGSRLTQERPKVIDRTFDKQPPKAAMDNTMMAQVLEQLKQMNNLLINNRPQLQPPHLPPTGPWYRNYVPPVPIPQGQIPQW